MDPDLAAVVLAGGAARRCGGRHKPAIPVAGTPMLDRVLAAVSRARPRVVVGPAQSTPDDVLLAREDPPLGGPAAAIFAGTRTVLDATRVRAELHRPGPTFVAVLAGDQPLLSAEAVGVLLAAVRSAPAEVGGAAYVDDDRPQWLCGVWRLAALARRCAESGGTDGKALAGSSVRALLSPLHPVLVAASADPPPWYDCDTPADLDRAAAALRAGSPEPYRSAGADRPDTATDSGRPNGERASW